jgi:hypothetical protein
VVEVMDAIKESGARELGMITERPWSQRGD